MILVLIDPIYVIASQDAGKRLDAIRAPLNQLGFSFVQIGVDEEVSRFTPGCSSRSTLVAIRQRTEKLIKYSHTYRRKKHSLTSMIIYVRSILFAIW